LTEICTVTGSSALTADADNAKAVMVVAAHSADMVARIEVFITLLPGNDMII
jgi:hypothetical protein